MRKLAPHKFANFGKTLGLSQRLLRRSVVDSNGCRLWLGARDSSGYGNLTYKNKTVATHRATWTEANGPIPAGLKVCHTCDIRHCIELEHLFLGTDADNSADMDAKGRRFISRGEKHGSAVLSPCQVLDIRNDPRTGAILAKEYEVSESTISRIKLRQRWSHL